MNNKYLTYSKYPTDPDTQFELFKKHWISTVKAMSKEYLTMEELEPVIYYMDQMLSLIIEENNIDNLKTRGPIFNYSLNQDVFNKIYECSSKFMGEALERIKHQQLRLFSDIVSKASESVLHYKEILQPLLRLVNSYSLRSSHKLELSLVHLLKLLCNRISNEPILQSLCKDIGINILKDPLPLLNPLVPFLHRDGILGEEAKSALILLVALSRDSEEIAISVSLQSDFCPVLATGLSALYSALPRKLPPYCHSILLGQLNDAVIRKYPPLQHFIGYLQFCCQVNEIAHPLVREAVLHYVYNGFLVPVIASSFHQNSIDEVITATIYFELCLRIITESGLLKAFLCFIVAENYDGSRLMDSILNRLHSNTGLGVATLSLMNTLISFYCEDVMFELIFRYLIPCRHLILTNNAKICDRESLKDSFDKFLELSFDPYHCEREIEEDLLTSANKALNMCNYACDLNWQFDYDGINPSPDYLEKVLDPSYVQSQKPFHGFLDHYAQLLEMRDMCRKQSNHSPVTSKRSSSTTDSIDLNGSCNFTPISPVSRSDSFDTITSLKFENDSQLAMCLQRLCYPSAEDLLEQKSHYVLSYHQITDDDSLVLSPPSTKNINNIAKCFDLVRTISDDSIESQPSDYGISKQYLEKLVNSKEIDEFAMNLNGIDIKQKNIRNCEFSLDDVMNTIMNLDENERNQKLKLENETHSSDVSLMSVESALAFEDNIIRQRTILLSSVKATMATTTKHIATVGLFLQTILERLERFHLNSFQFNLQLTTVVITLLSFPQPLIRNYLLNPHENLSSGIKCLYKVLSAVKSKLDVSKIKINISRKDDHYFTRICDDVRSRLENRLQYLENCDLESEDQIKMCGIFPTAEPEALVLSLNKNEKRNFNLLEFLSRKSNQNDLQVRNGGPSIKNRQTKEEIEYNNHLNLAFASVLFDEFCKEIASFSKEQYVFRR